MNKTIPNSRWQLGLAGHAGPKPEIKQPKLRSDDVFIRRHTPELPRSAPRGLILPYIYRSRHLEAELTASHQTGLCADGAAPVFPAACACPRARSGTSGGPLLHCPAAEGQRPRGGLAAKRARWRLETTPFRNCVLGLYILYYHT